ncbi:MBOAT family O-acyltransferase [Tichowtungia aerotolerans]|uniref:MBOAT family O-acyltransferase n=1 Tax=Tichowtungia aerotolerans TaxID=2697043 RepID=UPI0022B8E2C5|nr:MBOAT family O-acyltransferase [Tichowtungia aerotolerans]
MVIADRLAAYVSDVYGHPGSHPGIAVLLATYFFAFQIYCDFSAYSDIAIGAAQVMGFRLMDNFNRPYFSKTIAEFWSRWHISLSTWFRDYLYIPLGGNRCAKSRWLLNLLIVFIVSGLWHGAAWTYIIWGALHGLYLMLEILTGPFRKAASRKIRLDCHPHIHKFIQVFITFHLVCLSWIFFRADSLHDAVMLLKSLFLNFIPSLRPQAIVQAVTQVETRDGGLFMAFAVIAFMEIIHLMQRHRKMRRFMDDKPLIVRWAVYYAIVLSILLFGVVDSPFEFIYFQF